MIKLFIKLSLVCSLLLTGLAQATLLPVSHKLTLDDYIVYNYNGVDYDITWAASENAERWYDRNYDYNTLVGPSVRQGWGFAGENNIPRLTDIFANVTGDDLLSKFTRRNGSFIHSFSHWNTVFTEVDTTVFMGEVLGTLDIKNKNIRSQWSWSVPVNDDIALTDDLDDKKAQRSEIIGINTADYATFYIRQTASTPIPEPSTLMIFSLGLIALASKKKLFS